jgi:hypothetical protein
VFCRLTTQDTLFYDPDELKWYNEEEVVCDTPYDDNLYSIDLPPWLLQRTKSMQEGDGGDLWIRITDAHLDVENERIVLGEFPVFKLDTNPAFSEQRTEPIQARKAYNDAFGSRTYAIVLISTSDRSLSVTAQQMQARFTNSAVGFESTYRDCSANQIDWNLQGIHTVNLPGPLSQYANNPGQIRNAATTQLMQEKGLGSMEDLANNVLYCIPPGTGDWVANAGTNHWRSQFNDAWCISLTAVVHELGKYSAIMKSHLNLVFSATCLSHHCGFRMLS